jgi:2,5-diketo-D-gluconate reductase B
MHELTVQATTVPALGFGTWQLDGGEAREGVRHALELGYRHIDTAQMYENEEQVGAGIADAGVDRGDIFLATKLALDATEPDAVRRTTGESLRRLGTDYVDLLYIHWPPDHPVGRTLEAMRGLVDDGTVRHIGVSNFPPSLLREALAEAPVFANQVEYHPYLSQDTLVSLAAEHDLMLVAYSPLARGRVSDDPVLQSIGEAHGKTPGQVVLRWLLQQPRVATIPKSARAERREENAAVTDFELSDDEMKQIADLDEGERLIDPPFGPDWER